MSHCQLNKTGLVMIYYEIQHHGDIESVKSLCKLLQHSNNTVNISLNKLEQEIINDSKEMRNESLNFRSLSIEMSEDISWGGYSITNRMLKSLEQSLKSPEWKFYVNLSGSCIPLNSQNKIFTLLNKNIEAGMEDYCYSFIPQKKKIWFTGVNNNANNQTFGYGRVKFDVDNELLSLLRSGEFDPTKRVMHRVAAKYEEISKNRFSVSSLSLEEVKERNQFFDENKYRVGRQWVILSRETVEWIVSSLEVKKVLTLLKSCFISDEMLFQLVLNLDSNPKKEKLSIDSLRYMQGTPASISVDNIDEAWKTNAIFGRKVSTLSSKKVYEYINDRISHCEQR
jgi:hypothetical protein